MSTFSSVTRNILALACLAFGGAASAQTAINAAAVAAGGITPGDTPGYPATLSATGSYVLSGNLAPPSGTTAIAITGNFVSLDLKGFSIDGGNRCSENNNGPGNSCTAGQGAPLINVTGTNPRIRNGSVIGGQAEGIRTAHSLDGSFAGLQLSDLRVAHNRGVGIDSADHGVIARNLTANTNADSGTTFAAQATIAENVVTQFNNNYGFRSGSQSAIAGVVSASNVGSGVFADSGVLRHGNSSANGSEGFLGGATVAFSRASVNALVGVNASNLVYATAFNTNTQRAVVGSGCYSRLQNTPGSALSPQIQGTALNGSVTVCP